MGERTGPEPSGIALAHVKISLSGIEFETQVPAPKGRVPVRVMLPVIRAFAGAIIDASEKMAQERGVRPSCKAGCGACCRQLVPVALSEAIELRHVIEAMPEPRRVQIRARFVAGLERVRESGLLPELADPGRHPEKELSHIADKYFALGIACPFLEEESCSIYPDRPIVCREFLVSSDPKFCAEPKSDAIKPIPLAARVSTSLMRLDDKPGVDYPQWIPMIQLLEWSDNHTDAAPRPGTEILSKFLQHLGKDGDAGPLSEPA